MKNKKLKKGHVAPEICELTDEQLDNVVGGQNGRSMMMIAESNVGSTIDILKTLKEKVICAANDTNTDADIKAIQKEMDKSIAQIDENALRTFNGEILNDGGPF